MDKYVEQVRMRERQGECSTVRQPPAEQMEFVILELARQRDELRAKLRRLGRPQIVT